MATTQQPNAGGSPNAATMWAESAARCGYPVHNGLPLIGISGDEGSGHIVPVPVPAWFASVPSEGERDNTFRALAAHSLRVGQAKFKAADKPTREHAVDGVASAIAGTYKPARTRGDDIVESEAMRQLTAHVRALIREKISGEPTDKQVSDTTAKQAETEGGKKYLAATRAKIVESGTYEPNRKGKNAASGAVEISL